MKIDKNFARLAFHWMVIFLTVHLSRSLECYSCQSTANQFTCNHTVTCGQNEFCFLDKRENHYTSGCATSQQCSGGSSTSVSLVGRNILNDQLSASSERSSRPVRLSSSCHECCSTDNCNDRICVHPQPSACVDDETVDCARMSTLFSICNDVQKAKLVCPKFCDLCSLVDGEWASWTAWSPCSVTCESGTESRNRTCTNPAPANGGMDCVGISTETKSCVKEACPIHGGWSQWSDWGPCSVTCEVGIQRRNRSCNNPYPSRFGEHCFGESQDFKICLQGGCTVGNWSDWGTWSACSDSCGGGVKTRERTCTNPPPSLLGRFCSGSSVQTRSCNKQGCPVSTLANCGNPSITGLCTCANDCPGAVHDVSCECANGLSNDFIPVPNRAVGGWNIFNQTNLSATQCMTLCVSTAGCLSIDFSKTGNVCWLNSESPFTKPNSYFIDYQYDLYVRKCLCDK